MGRIGILIYGIFAYATFVVAILYLVGFLGNIWATAHMTLGHMLFSVTMTLYILGATALEERDLIDMHGDVYRDYRKRVPMLFPRRIIRKSDHSGLSKN